MDVETVLVSLGVAGIALLPRIPGLSADERRRVRIMGDTELWTAMPKSHTRDALAAQIASATRLMLEERARDRTIEQSWRYGTSFVFVGWVLIVASRSIPEQPMWAEPVRALVGWLGIGVALAGVALLMMMVATALLRAVAWVFNWRNARRARGIETADDSASDEQSPSMTGR